MKVAVSSTGGGLDAPVDPRFGRCPYHLIVDTDTLSFEALPNASMGAPSGAGIGAAQAVAQKEVGAVLTGNIGPNATAVLSQAGIKMFTGATGTVRQTLKAFKDGKLTTAPTIGFSRVGYGMRRGGGRGMGRGMGMGQGMGMGRGMGMQSSEIGTGTYGYPSQLATPMQSPSPTTREQEIKMLTQQLEQLEKQLEEVKKRLEELK